MVYFEERSLLYGLDAVDDACEVKLFVFEIIQGHGVVIQKDGLDIELCKDVVALTGKV